MTTRTLFLRAAAAALFTAAMAWAQAHSYDVGDLHIAHPWAKPTVAGQPVGGGYLKLTNKGATADRLVSARAEVSKSVELHSMRMDGNVMRMQEVSAIEIPAGQTVELKPGGLHLMLMGLKAPLKAGERVPLVLKFERAGEVKVELAVEAPKAEVGKPAEAVHDHKH